MQGFSGTNLRPLFLALAFIFGPYIQGLSPAKPPSSLFFLFLSPSSVIMSNVDSVLDSLVSNVDSVLDSLVDDDASVFPLLWLRALRGLLAHPHRPGRFVLWGLVEAGSKVRHQMLLVKRFILLFV
ncbi:hypothetical protein MHU86_5485 [Fragilaria crotonensis]|nr:hypothetical protein MHU86_5485 [Fragilaria crotonensis]